MTEEKREFDQQALADSIQKNCDIADARHGAEYTLCIYLMKMREYYRWEQGLSFSERLGKERVGDWLVQKEAYWIDLEGADYINVAIANDVHAPFETQSINQGLLAQGLLYGGGLGHAGKPHFFLAELLQHEQVDGYTLYVGGKEFARDLSSPPGMSTGNEIFIRRESLKRMLWERLENWRWSSPDNAMGRALAHYDFENDLEYSLEAMTEVETKAVLWHEIGEIYASREFGDKWNQMLCSIPATPAELMARTVRDHYADCCVTLPRLVAQEDAASIHFYIGNLSNMRKSLFPELILAYEQWRDGEGLNHLDKIASIGEVYWRELAHGLLSLFDGEQESKTLAADIKTYIERSRGQPLVH